METSQASNLRFMHSPHVCHVCCVQSLSRVWLSATPWPLVHLASLSMKFPRQEYWSRLPFSTPGDLPDLESNLCLLCLLHLRVDSLPLYHLGGPYIVIKNPLPNAGDAGSVPELGKSPGEGNSNWLQYSCLANSKDRGVLQATAKFSSVTKSCPTLCTLEMQHARLPCPSPSPGIYSNSCPLGLWCHPTISSVIPLSSCLSLSQHQGLFQWVSSSHHMAKVLEL